MINPGLQKVVSSLGFVNNFITTVQLYTNAFGKLWWTITAVFRILIILTLGSSIFTDTLNENFRCKNADDICTQACFNSFSSINPARFWKFQLVFLLLPVIFFYSYVNKIVVRIRKIKAIEKERDSLLFDGNDENRKRVLEKQLSKIEEHGGVGVDYGTKERFLLDKGEISSAYMTKGIQLFQKLNQKFVKL